MKINGNFDFIVIDGAPRMTDLARAAIISSDFIIMPMQPSGYDLWATNELIQMVEEAKIYKSNLITAVVLNRVVGNTILAREMTKNMQENNWQFFDTNIHQRQLYSLAATQGLTVFDVDSKSESAKEISKFTDELLKVIKS
jgi:chromosome partitioning protein